MDGAGRATAGEQSCFPSAACCAAAQAVDGVMGKHLRCCFEDAQHVLGKYPIVYVAASQDPCGQDIDRRDEFAVF